MKKQPVLFFGKFLRSAAGTQNYAKASLLFQGQGSSINSRRMQGFSRRGQRQWQYPRHVLAFAFLHPGQLVEIWHLPGNLHRNFGRIETGNASNPTFSPQGGLGECGVPHTIGTNASHSCDHHASLHSVTPVVRSRLYTKGWMHTVPNTNPRGKRIVISMQ